jgi:hypothetical protein
MPISKLASPTGSYSLELPPDTHEELDGRVASYWRVGQNVLLQTSSYVRGEGEQVSASDRLRARLPKEKLSGVTNQGIAIPQCPDCASASGIDDQGFRWIFCYGVWPDLTIFISISGPNEELSEYGGWAFEAIRSLRRITFPSAAQ